MENIRSQSYLTHKIQSNCDSTEGITIVMRISANLELQRQDSLLHQTHQILSGRLEESYDDSHRIWINQLCDSCKVDVLEGSFDAVLFMDCFSEQLKNRRIFLENEYDIISR